MGHQTPSVTKALRLVDSGMSGYAAARKTGIALSTIYRALARRKRSNALTSAALAKS